MGGGRDGAEAAAEGALPGRKQLHTKTEECTHRWQEKEGRMRKRA